MIRPGRLEGDKAAMQFPRRAPVIDEVPRTALQAEIGALPPTHRLFESGGFSVCCARAGEIPQVLREIGRLRELTFRAVGEGTGRRFDLDTFDAHYSHMFVWDSRASAIVGAYRLGLVDQILARHGKRGLYTYSLFEYPTRLLDLLNPAIELGRSFVRAEYQRSFAPLLLLWRGIGRFVARSPRYAILFGPVSISSWYAPASRQLLVEYLSGYQADTSLVSQVTARRPLRDQTRPAASDTAVSGLTNIAELSRRIGRIEPDGKGVPVLVRHYLRLGGRLLGFSVDAEFGDTLDALMMLDLRRVDPTLLARYMGHAQSVAFHAYHARDSRAFGTARSRQD